MRILFDSKSLTHKTPFGTLTPEDKCTLNLYIPASVKASRVQCLLQKEDGTPFREVEMRCLHLRKSTLINPIAIAK